MEIPLRIETQDRRLAMSIAGDGKKLTAGTVVDAPGGVKVEYRYIYDTKSYDPIPAILEFIVDASKVIDLGLFSAWLYDKVKDRPVDKITIGRTETTEVTEEGIRRIVEEELRIRE